MTVFLLLAVGVVVALLLDDGPPVANWRRYTLEDDEAKKLQAHLNKE